MSTSSSTSSYHSQLKSSMKSHSRPSNQSSLSDIPEKPKSAHAFPAGLTVSIGSSVSFKEVSSVQKQHTFQEQNYRNEDLCLTSQMKSSSSSYSPTSSLAQFSFRPSSQSLTQLSNSSNSSSANSSPTLSHSDWVRLMKSKTVETTPYSTVKRALQFGVKRSLRPRIWMWLANVKSQIRSHGSSFYNRIAGTTNVKWQSEISKDIHRTFGPDSIFYESQSALKCLFRMLNALSNYDDYAATKLPSIGYAQGTNVIAGVILQTFLDPRNQKNTLHSFGRESITQDELEEIAFWVLLFVMREKNHEKIFLSNMAKRHQLLDALKIKLNEVAPKVLGHFEEKQVDLGIAFDSELFSILSYKSPLPLAQFTLDHVLLDGHAALIDIIARITNVSSKAILQCRSAEAIIEFMHGSKNPLAWEKYQKTPNELITYEYMTYEVDSQHSQNNMQEYLVHY